MARNRPVVGVDLSLTSTGVALPNGALIVVAPQTTGARRLVSIRNELDDLVDGYSNPLIVVEGYSFAQKNSQAHSIGELGGVMKASWYEQQLQVVVVPPTSRAKFATGRGNASKSEVVSAVSARRGKPFEGPGADDKCDAWILREMGMVALGQSRRKWPAKNMEVMEKIDWPSKTGDTARNDE